ncbi:protein RESTRICTED TEV MOVEMENT 1 isoform X2 [Raphanus sativus]|uniref:Protein RESTRICTED TEV MOVEMENT 1 isoform X2 n=1 Tax=Raphanus sativus TaxID=3726 RepID=A0A6J0N954_RAPSA|nr:protein RESTRICTED TEV MOVEMENT 1 isoform X2 [Raphanus sativus]
MEGLMKIGPVGKHDAKSTTLVSWDEGLSHNGILTQIFLSHGVGGIMSIQFQSVIDGKFVLSDCHGPCLGNMFDVIELTYPHEYITGISGEYYKYEGSNPHIRSLKFTTNTSEYGPFGTSVSGYEKFSFKLGRSPQFGGFHGTYDASGLQLIGFYLRPKTVQPKIAKSNAEELESKIVLG